MTEFFITKDFKEVHNQLGMENAISNYDEGFAMYNLKDFGYQAPYTSSVFRPNYFVFLFVKQGKGTWMSSKKKYDLIPNTINFTNINFAKQFQYENLDEVHIIIFEEYFIKKYVDNKIYQRLPFLLSENIMPHVATDDFFQELENIYMQMYKEYNRNTKNHNIIAHFLAIILHKFNNEYFKDYDPILEGDKNSVIVNNFKLHLEENFTNLINGSTFKLLKASDYAQLQNYQTSYFNSIIISKTGKSITTWISDRIIYESKILLELSDLSIKQISNLFEYSEATHFTFFFKKKTGMTPKQYRQEK